MTVNGQQMSLLSFYCENYQGSLVFANIVVKEQILNGTCLGEWLCFLDEQTFRSIVKIDNFFKNLTSSCLMVAN